MQVRELMTRDPAVLTPEGTVGEAARLMRKLDVGIIPVVDDPDTKRLRGVITDRDIAIRHVAEDHTDDCPVSEHMTVEVRTVRSDESHHDVMRAMRSEKVRRVAVVDEEGRLVGIVAQADLAVDTGPQQRDEVKETLEEVSQPARPERSPR